jgi:hypothetical protein
MFGGLFGKKKQPMTGSYNVDGTQVSMDMIPTTAGGRYGDPMPQQQEQRGGFLKPYGTGQLLFSALSDLGAAINDRQGGALAGMTQDMMMQRERAAKQAEALRMQAERMAAAQRLGIGQDEAMLLGDNIGSVVANQLKGPEQDAFDRAMERAGIAKGSPQYNQMAQQYATRTAMGPDPILQNARLPSGGEFTGPLTAYEQMIRGGGQQQAPAPQILPRSARPQGKSDDQLFAEARQAVEGGANVDTVFRQLREWGVEVN